MKNINRFLRPLMVAGVICFLIPQALFAQGTTGSNTSFTFTPGTGVTCVFVQTWGGGGAGGGADGNGTHSGGGGGGGAYNAGTLSVTPGNLYSVTVGVGGTGVSGGNGGAGGSSSFAGTIIANGGGGGSLSSGSTNTVGGPGGAGGTGGLYNGGNGAAGVSATPMSGGGGGGAGDATAGSNASGGTAGLGGISGGGTGGGGVSTSTNGNSGSAYGGGGGGGNRIGGSGFTAAGGNGAAGYVKVTWYATFSAGAINTTGESICYGGDPGTIGSSSGASGGDGNYTYQWQSGTDGINFPTTISNNSPTYDPPGGLTVTTYYRRQAHDGTCNTGWVTSSGVWIVTVNALPTFTTSYSNISCFNAGDGQITITVTSGPSPYYFSLDNGSSYTPTTNTSPYTFTGLTPGTYKVRVKDANGCESPVCP